LDIYQNVTSPYPIPFFGNRDFSDSTNNNDFSWRLSAQYDVTPDVMAYGTVARGYKGPGFNLSYNAVTGDVGPERSMNYEIGVKTQISDAVLFNISAYGETIKDLQVQAFIPAQLAYLIANAGTLRARGVEMDLRVSPADDLVFSLQGAFNDAEYTSFPGAPCFNGQTVAEGCVAGVSDATGNPLQNAPKYSGTFAVDYSHAAGSSYRMYFHADLYARSKVNFHPSKDPFMEQKGYALANASIGFGPDSDAWKLSVFCRNCFDQRFVTFIEPNPATGFSSIPGERSYGQTFGLTSFRTIGVSFDVKMDF
jgi:iron complex outermembrane recepter protein